MCGRKRQNAKPNTSIKNLDQKERNIWEIAITSFKGWGMVSFIHLWVSKNKFIWIYVLVLASWFCWCFAETNVNLHLNTTNFLVSLKIIIIFQGDSLEALICRKMIELYLTFFIRILWNYLPPLNYNWQRN